VAKGQKRVGWWFGMIGHNFINEISKFKNCSGEIVNEHRQRASNRNLAALRRGLYSSSELAEQQKSTEEEPKKDDDDEFEKSGINGDGRIDALVDGQKDPILRKIVDFNRPPIILSLERSNPVNLLWKIGLKEQKQFSQPIIGICHQRHSLDDKIIIELRVMSKLAKIEENHRMVPGHWLLLLKLLMICQKQQPNQPSPQKDKLQRNLRQHQQPKLNWSKTLTMPKGKQQLWQSQQ